MEVWRKNLYILWGTQFLAMLGMNLVIPFLPFYVRELGVADEADVALWSGIAFSGTFLSAFIATPFWGTLGDRYGRKIMVLRAIIGLSISQVLIGLSQNVVQLLVFRIIQGAISGFIASALALVSTHTPREKTGYALGFLQSSTAAGMVLGPVIGGILADLIGYREIFFVTAGLCGIGAFIVALGVRDSTHTSSEGRRFSVLQNYQYVYAHKELRIVGICLVIAQMAVLMIEPIFALFIERLSTGTRFVSTVTGGVFSIAGICMVISAPWWGKLSDRAGHGKNLAAALTIAGLAYAGHTLAQNLFQLGAVRAVLGFARGAVLPGLYSLASLHSPHERRGGIMAVASSLTLLGNTAGPLIGGFIGGHFGLHAAFFASSGVLLSLSFLVRRSFSQIAPMQTQAAAVTPSNTSHGDERA